MCFDNVLIFLFLFTVGGRGVRHGTEFCHPGRPEYTTHVGIIGSLSTKLAGNLINRLIFYFSTQGTEISGG